MTATGATELQHAPARAMRWSAHQVAMAVAALSALWFVVGVNVPRLWADEQFTDQVSRMSWSRFWAMLGKRDAVHGAYYALVRLSPLHGWPMRLLSTAATAAAAGGVYLLARRLAGPRAAWIAAVLFAGAPMTTRFAQEARPTAFVTAAAVFSTLALVERRWGWYAAGVAALGSLSIFGLLLLPAHFLMFSAPALALLAAVGLARLPLRWLAAVLTVLALVALPVHAFTRTSAGHGGTIDYYQLG